MVADVNVQLQYEVTKTATFQGGAVDLGAAGPARGWLEAIVQYAAAANASGSNTVTFSVEQSADATTWYLLASGAADALALGTTPQAGELTIPFRAAKRYVRLVCTITGAGSGPTVTYYATMGL